MPLFWNERSPSIVVVAAMCALAMVSCSAQSQSDLPQTEDPPPVKPKKRPAPAQDASASDNDDARDAGAADAETRISTRESERDANKDAGDASEAEPAEMERDASISEEPERVDAGSPQQPDAREKEQPKAPAPKTEEPKPKVDAECTRVRLREKAEAYLQSLNTGDTMPLRLHDSFRYTENGRDEAIGGAAWLRRGETLFSRHVLDETRCSTLTQAVMSGVTGRFSFGVRLRYSDGLLLEAEAQVVPEVLAATDLDTVIPMGDDAFVADVPQNQRMTRDELFAVAQRYFDSVTGISLLPPSAPECRRLQNGLPLGDGTCTEPPGTARFEQQRFDLADEPRGIVAATVLYNDHIGIYLLKMSNDMLQNIQVIGGATSQATGW